jgi:uncharacterized protein (DUF1499 family)
MVRWKRVTLVVAVILVLGPVVLLAGLSAMSGKPENLGVRDGRLADCPDSPNCVCSQAADAEHRIEPLTFTDSPGEALARLRQALQALPRTTIITDADGYLHAECRSLIFRFVDDVEFLVDPDARVIHCRSASRVGRSDLGVNRQRIEELRRAFEQATGG